MFSEFSDFRHISRKGPHKQTIETTAAQPPSGGWAAVVSVVWLWGLPGKHAGNRKTRKTMWGRSSSESSDFEARRLRGPENRPCFPAEGAARLGRARGLWPCFPAEGAARLGRASGLWTDGRDGGGVEGLEGMGP